MRDDNVPVAYLFRRKEGERDVYARFDDMGYASETTEFVCATIFTKAQLGKYLDLLHGSNWQHQQFYLACVRISGPL